MSCPRSALARRIRSCRRYSAARAARGILLRGEKFLRLERGHAAETRRR